MGLQSLVCRGTVIALDGVKTHNYINRRVLVHRVMIQLDSMVLQ
jgi:hypothetical protein